MSAPIWFKPTGVLDPEKHSMFIANRENIARDAGIPQELLWKALPALFATSGTPDANVSPRAACHLQRERITKSESKTRSMTITKRV